MSKHQAEVQKRIGYTFTNEDLLAQAFIRKSYSAENGGVDNEVLEFIGDKALDLAIIRVMMGRFALVAPSGKRYLTTAQNEKGFTNIKKELVAKKALSASMERLGFQKYLVMGAGDIKCGAQENDSVKEDLFEAILGAVTLDCGWNMDVITRTTQNMIDLDAFFQDLATDEEKMDENYVGKVQEWTQGKGYGRPDYTYRETAVGFCCHLSVPKAGLWADGEGQSKSAARMAAAKAFYLNLPKKNVFSEVLATLPTVKDAVSRLKIFADKKLITAPEYMYKEARGNGISPCWNCKLTVGGFSCDDTASTKKEAAHRCAEKAVEHLLQNA